ncbi:MULTISPECIES: 3-isopropylmalate dehydratase small subunit [Micrococcaceae]|jgi:3-isopropylmalate/(R)-2-methylmalate dehydratase small subunit|uniref:3-isopropylmalate dehydratase small subunit n=1 Tax=Micrococcaceae TaxID=1268 RepID=UPI0020979745|nr:3-isopropylmalate dehydratase small subunit [Arthrobacter sp. H16F315]MDD1475383.1 3-isopropylmalate dehydratase small subunit [Arthrobacter sp. H16F315]
MMRTTIAGRMVPLDRDGVDTDTMMPQEFLKGTDMEGFGKAVFHHWRQSGQIPLDDPVRAGARVLVAGRNFGIGSSREHAVWGLAQWGFEAVVAVEFGDIFASNCVKNGIAPIAVREEECRDLRQLTESDPLAPVTIDLWGCRLWAAGISASFTLAPIIQRMLIEGLDEIALTETLLDSIEAYERDRPPWEPTTSALERGPENPGMKTRVPLQGLPGTPLPAGRPERSGTNHAAPTATKKRNSEEQ